MDSSSGEFSGMVTRRALTTTREFVRIHASGADGWPEVLESIAYTARGDQAGLRDTMAAINRILVDPAVAGDLLRLVAWDANWPVDDLAEARNWLRELVDAIRAALSAGGSGPDRT